MGIRCLWWNCREPKTLNDTQYLHLHLIRSETADTRPQHVVFTCGLRNTVKASFLKVETWRVWCRGEVWRCMMDIPGYHAVPSSSSSVLTPPASPTAPERSWGVLLAALIEQLNLNETRSEIQMFMSGLIGNRTQLQHNSSCGPNSGLSYDLASPVRAQGICILLCFHDFVL